MGTLKYCDSFIYINIFLLGIFVLLFTMLYFKAQLNKIKFISFACLLIGTIVISFPPFGWTYPRVISTNLFLVVTISIYFFVPLKFSREINDVICGMLCFLIVFQCGNMYLTVEKAGRIEDTRKESAKYVSNLQATNQWDYENDILLFPKHYIYRADFDFEYSIETQYKLFLQYYGLKDGTKIRLY